MTIIPWCEAHQERGNPNFNNHSCWKATKGDQDYKPCQMVRMGLLPLGEPPAEIPEHWSRRMKLRKPCAHGAYDAHEESALQRHLAGIRSDSGWCPGGSEPSTADLLAAVDRRFRRPSNP